MNPRVLLLLCLLVLMLSLPAVAGQYYADINITVEEDGWSSVTGTTNHPVLDVNETQEWTTQEGRYWLINITAPGQFSNFIYRLNFPPNADINYINTPTITRIQDTTKGLSLVGIGENSPFYIVAQYTIAREETGARTWQIPVYAIGGIVLVLAGVYHLIGNRLRRGRKRSLQALSERQRLIYKTLEKHKKPLTQGDIQKETQLPKASLSRNIEALVGKGILKKEARGMSNVIYLNEDVPERSGMFRQR